MAIQKQREEARSRKPRHHRKNSQMEELPTFAKWLSPFTHSDPDLISKSKPLRTAPLVLLDSSDQAPAVAANVTNSLEEQGPAMADSISTRRGCYCWRPSKSTLPESSTEFQVAAGTTFQICWGRKLPPRVPNLPEQRGSRNCHSKSATFQIFGRRKMAVADVPNLEKEVGMATDVPDLRKEELAASGPDLAEEGEATVAPDLRKGGTGCCGRWECLPAFQICRRRRTKVVSGNEDVTADVPNVPEVEEVASDDAGVVNMQKGISEEEDYRSAKRAGCLQAFKICAGRKRVIGDPDQLEKEAAVAADVDVSDLQVEEVAAAAVLEKSARGGSCCPFQFCVRGWLPKFVLCGGRTAVDTSNRQEEEETASLGVENLGEGVVSDDIPIPSKENVPAGDAPGLHNEENVEAVAIGVQDLGEEEAVATGDQDQDLCKEESVGSSIVDLGQEEEEEGGCRCFKLAGKEGGRRHRHRRRRSRPREEGCRAFQICWPFHICSGKKKVPVSIPNSHEEEGLVVNGVVAATDCSKSTRGCDCWQSKPRRRWLPTFQMFRRTTVPVAGQTLSLEQGGNGDGEVSKGREMRESDSERNSNFFK